MGTGLAGVCFLALTLWSPLLCSAADAVPANDRSKAGSDVARLATDYSSIFTDPELVGSGWTKCDAPIEWSVDARALKVGAAPKEIASLHWAFDVWAKASGLTFKYAGQTSLHYNESDFTLTPANGESPVRQIRIDFIAPGASKFLRGNIIGQGSPTARTIVREIVSGTAIFSADHIQSASQGQARSEYLHELGHVLGLAHAHNRANIMFAVIGNKPRLGLGDVRGVQALVKPCSGNGGALIGTVPPLLPLPSVPALPIAPQLPPVVLPPVSVPAISP